MLFHLKVNIVRLIVSVAVLVGMIGTVPVRPVYAAPLVVSNTNDSGPGSLRQAILDAASGDTITFAPALAGGTIALNSQLTISKDLTIDGSALNPQVRLSGQSASRIIEIIFNAQMTISSLVFTQGVSTTGGAIHATGNAQLKLENSTFHQNQASLSGGAISVEGNSTGAIVNSMFSQNQAGGSGGAISIVENGNYNVIHSTLVDNSASGDGGAVAGFNVRLIGSTLSRNSSGGSGGGVSAVKLEIDSTTIDRNLATFNGGGIALDGNTISTIVNSTVTENQANSSGGAISINGNPYLQLWNSTFAANHAPVGTEVRAIGNGTVALANTILACLPGDQGCIVQSGNTLISGPHSIIAAGTLASFGLAELADNGGPTQTMALLSGSPLIDAGDDAVCANSSVKHVDQRGVTRPQGSHCDIGAYERQFLIRYVKQDATAPNDGSSWAHAHTDLQSALAAAAPDEEIWVAAGTYKPTSTTDRTISFTLKNGVALCGGFAGTETSRMQRNYQANVTSLSGDIGATGDNSDNSYHVVVGSNTNSSAILDGFTITAGKAKDTLDFSPESRGGGMYSYLGSPTVRNVIFTDNFAALGGGMYNGGDFGFPETATYPVLTNVTFQNNSAIEGGGLFNESYVHANLTNVTFNGNTVTRAGGGMEDRLGYLSLTNVVFKNNTAGLAAGGMQIFSLQASLTNVTLQGNSATRYGGGMVISDSDPNLASTLTNVTLSGNSAEFGGGIWIHESDPLLTNVTFQDNSASTSGGGVYSESNANIAIDNTIFWGNTAPVGAQLYNDNTSVYTVGDSVVQGGYASGTNIITTDPLLGSLGSHGGFTETIPLQPGSSAIDTGSDTNCPATDQRGVTRPQGSHCDIGAYEYQDTTVPVVLSIVRTTASPTSAPSLQFAVTFSEPVTNVDTNDFAPQSTGGLTGAAVTNVSGSGSLYLVTVNTGSGNGTLRLDVPASATITGLDTNSLGSLPFIGGEAYSVLKTASFSDVESAYWAWSFIERLYLSGITKGCLATPAQYCPEATVTRAQMAVFLERGIHGSSYAPPPVGASTGFGDVPINYWSAAWIKQLAADGITSGCGGGNYCPEESVTRAQMAVFLLRAKHGAAYTPPALGGTTGFGDVPLDHWAAAWIKQLAAEGITGGCGGGNYCPDAPVTRAQMAVFLVRTFNLP